MGHSGRENTMTKGDERWQNIIETETFNITRTEYGSRERQERYSCISKKEPGYLKSA